LCGIIGVYSDINTPNMAFIYGSMTDTSRQVNSLLDRWTNFNVGTFVMYNKPTSSRKYEADRTAESTNKTFNHHLD